MKQKEKLLSVNQAAGALGVSRQRVMQFIYEDRLPASKVGYSWIIKESDLESVKDRPTGRPPKKQRD